MKPAIGRRQLEGSFVIATPIAWLGIPKRSRRTMSGGVRTEHHTLPAPPSARSTAISAPELPEPTTSTERPRYGSGLRYSREWRSSPEKRSLPGQSGTTGSFE